MKFVRNVLHDLVEKKLWPVAVALLAGVVAVPFVLGGSSSGGTSTDVASVPTVGSGAAGARDVARGKAISLAQQSTGVVDRRGAVRNPFVQHHLGKAKSAADTAVSTTSDLVNSLSASSSGSSSSSSGGTTATTPAATTPTTTGGTGTTQTKKSSGSSTSTYSVSFKFGEDGAEKTYNNVARLTPLPSSDTPFFVFLGLSDDGKSAVFMVDSDAVPTGDGICKPSVSDCQQVVLKDGEMEFFDLQSGTAGVVQYQLEITKIHKGKASQASAARAHARESRAGREYLRQVVADNPDALGDWSFSAHSGLLVAKDASSSSAADTVANVPKALASAAAGTASASSATPALTTQP